MVKNIMFMHSTETHLSCGRCPINIGIIPPGVKDLVANLLLEIIAEERLGNISNDNGDVIFCSKITSMACKRSSFSLLSWRTLAHIGNIESTGNWTPFGKLKKLVFHASSGSVSRMARRLTQIENSINKVHFNYL